MTITAAHSAEAFLVRESSLYADVWDVVPADYGMSRADVERDLAVAWSDPIIDEDGVLRYEGLDWDYVSDPSGSDYVLP